jgi:high-affinity iron transporter
LLAALLIVFREVLEAGLVIGIVLAVTRGIAHRGLWIGAGILAGTLAACVVALFTGALSDAFGGAGQELFSATILMIAVLMLTWHNVWMARHGRELAADMRAVGEAVNEGSKPLTALAIVVAVAVLREGAEVVLFLYAVILSEGGANLGIVAGGLGGIALGAILSMLIYFGLLRIPARYLFSVTSIMIALLAAGMAAQATHFLERANIVTALGAIAWNSSWLLSESSMPGRVLHTLIGYSDQPTVMQLIVYAATLGVILTLMSVFTPARSIEKQRPKTAASH